MIFETERLIVRKLNESDIESFFDLMGNPEVTRPIPQEAKTREESDKLLQELIDLYAQQTEKKVWALDTVNGDRFIGLCGLIRNNDDEDEIAYRLREQYWGKSYGTEIAKGLIDFGFEQLNFATITADVNITNTKSVKILDRFLKRHHEFVNERDNCTDRRYKLTRAQWHDRFSNQKLK